MIGSIRFRLLINVESDGPCYLLNNNLMIFKSSIITLRIVVSTSYINYSNVNGDEIQLSKDKLTNCLLYNYEQLFERHLNDYQSLFNRVQLNLGETEAMLQPTDSRIQLFSQNPNSDPQLLTLYFQYGRYLLISSSRLGSQAATLQGVWNDSMTPSWESKYTTNINIEMNYWPAGPANLIECYQPLFDLIQDLSETGQSTAKIHYGTVMEGSWVCHHNTDIWRGTAPVDGPGSGTWPTGGVWLCKSIWDHYLFTNDQTNLRRYYPVLRSAAQFFLETLIKSSGYLLTSPSISPEIAHHAQLKAVVCQGPTLDMHLLKDLFHSVIQTSILFNIDLEFREQVQQALNQLPPVQIGQLGQIQEWFEDWDEQADIHNRHMFVSFCFEIISKIFSFQGLICIVFILEIQLQLKHHLIVMQLFVH
jgi:alpha-L-fucosidase 2